MLEEFKKFALRGNVVDLAIGVIIGAAFGRIVEFGLRHGRLSIRFLFPPGSTALLPTVGAGDTNRVWLRQIAQQAAERAACLELTGHASPTGSPAANDRLSLARRLCSRGRRSQRRFVMSTSRVRRRP